MDPELVRRQVLRQARYALNVQALSGDSVPPEGPFDVALTNGLLAIVAERDPALTVDGKGRMKPASELLGVAAGLGLNFDAATLKDGLDVSQPSRHGRADDEWITLGPSHITALRDLDSHPGLQVLDSAAEHATVDDLIVSLFEARARDLVGFGRVDLKTELELPKPEPCDECWRNTFIPTGHDDHGGTLVAGSCLACGYQRSDESAWEMYMDREWDEHWKHL